ncbi:hypothetical protein CCACVL1_06171 [Corchorus capsularis]|uniref:Uncharacterized protein n=1 Tax=Corchorus capsularis TaxID=210143 RepID=A0A1R3JH07_COCAP|nr:hypothetical protein CCACVL1_06171 [Corchorus capsularis]
MLLDYGVDKYDIGTGFGHFGIAVEDAFSMELLRTRDNPEYKVHSIVKASCSSLISSKEVSWHATPYEERLKKALSDESHLSEELTCSASLRTNKSALSGVVFQPFEEVKKAEIAIPITPHKFYLLTRNMKINVKPQSSHIRGPSCAEGCAGGEKERD